MKDELEGFFWLLRLCLFSAKASEGLACDTVAQALYYRREYFYSPETDWIHGWLNSHAAEGRAYGKLLGEAARFWTPKFKLTSGRLEYL